MLGAVFNAEFALDAPGFAVFGRHGPVLVHIGTKRANAFLIPGNNPNDGLGAFVRACLASGTFAGVYFRKAVIAHFDGVEFADFHAVAKALAAPDAAFYAAG